MDNEIIRLVKIGADRANLYGKLAAMYQVQSLIQKEINELERKLDLDDKQK